MDNRPPLFTLIEGFKWPSFGFPKEHFHQIQTLNLREGDVILNTYPKCGTNWTAYILWEILNEGLPPPQPIELLKHQFPFVDKFGVTNFRNQNSSPRALLCHVSLPYFPISSSVKYIVTVRNPFDCCVSLYHFLMSKIVQVTIEISFEEFFELFLNGDVAYGDYFDHLLPWYEKRNDPNVLLLVYEEMVQDRKKCVLDVARFLGEEHLQKMEGQTLEKVLEHTSFEYMKATLSYKSLESEETKDKQDVDFFRKGIVGDWRTCFTESQKLRLKQRLVERLAGTQLLDYWIQTLEL